MQKLNKNEFLKNKRTHTQQTHASNWKKVLAYILLLLGAHLICVKPPAKLFKLYF